MGKLSDIKAAMDVIRITKSGGTAKLSISQITMLITNMSDAQRNLTPEQFQAVYTLYKNLRKCNTKMEMDKNGYFETATDIIKKFDALAPYEKYSGNNELETSFMMDEIRKDDTMSKNQIYANDVNDIVEMVLYGISEASEDDKNAFSILLKYGNLINTETEEYIDYIVKADVAVANRITRDDVKAVSAIRICNNYFGKNAALRIFDKLATRIIKEVDGITATNKISFLAGLLCDDVLTQEEMKTLIDKYTEPLIAKAILQAEANRLLNDNNGATRDSTYYYILGITETATLQEIKSAYLTVYKLLDVNDPNREAQIKLLNDAYAFTKNASKQVSK